MAKTSRAEEYNYQISWSTKDQVFVGHVLEFSSLAAHGDTEEEALKEIKSVVEFVISDLEKNGEYVPKPITFMVEGALNLMRRKSKDISRKELIDMIARLRGLLVDISIDVAPAPGSFEECLKTKIQNVLAMTTFDIEED